MANTLKTGRVRKTSPTGLIRARALFGKIRLNHNLIHREGNLVRVIDQAENLLDEVAILRPSVLALQAEVKLLRRRITQARRALSAQ